MKKVHVLFILVAVGMLGLTATSQAQFDRSLDPVIVNGSECGAFNNDSIANLRVYVYNSGNGTWSPIPFQVDEFRIKDGTVDVKEIVWNADGILTAVDEIVFMAKDMGQKAPDVQTWPNDEASRKKQRYEVVCTDPSNGSTAYAYIYSSTTLPLSNVSYVTYKNDRIKGETYGMAHHSEVASGFPDSLAILGNNIDILDSWRIRAKIDKLVIEADLGFGKVPFTATKISFSERMKNSEIKLTYGFITVTVFATAFHETDALKIKSGSVRVLREHILAVEFKTTGLVDTSRIPITTVYYGKSIDFKPSFDLNIGETVKELDLEYIEFSQGFNSQSMQVKFYGNNFVNGTAQDSLINKSPENTIFKKVLSAADWPGKHWYGFSGAAGSSINNASFLTICELNGERIIPNTSLPPALFYYDYKNDADDAAIYGISGLRIYDWKKKTTNDAFEIDSRFRSYYLTQNSKRSELQALFNKYSLPTTLAFSAQTYPDVVKPGVVTDLRIVARTDTSVTLAWTAPGDDGYSGGQAKSYIVRFSNVAPINMTGPDNAWWNALTTQNIHWTLLPAPADPGTQQTMTVMGLNEATIYYFRMNVVDDVGLDSGLSNTAYGTTTPVELASFSAETTPANQVVLKWVTESESNNLGFDIQRRRDGEDDWHKIGFIQGAGTSSERHAYSYIDTPARPGQWFYRLRQVDTDGTSTLSDQVSAVISMPQTFALGQNYPNPFNGTTVITFQLPDGANGEFSLILYDMLGRQVRTMMKGAAEPGYYSYHWDGRDDSGTLVGSGVYVYFLRTGDKNAARKMIKLQ